MGEIKMIKKNSVIDIKISNAFLRKLHEVLVYISKDLDEESLKAYQKEADDLKSKNVENPVFSQDWMNHLTTLVILIREVEVEAEKQGHVYTRNLDDDPETFKEDFNLE